MQLGAQLQVMAREQLIGSHLIHPRCAPLGFGRADRDQLLGETHDAVMIAAGHALQALTVVQRDGLALAIARDAVVRPPRDRGLHHEAVAALDENLAQIAVRVGIAGIHDDAATGETAKPSGRNRRRDSGAQGLIAHGDLGHRRARRELKIEQNDQRSHGQCQQPHGRRHARHAHPAGLSRYHLAVVIEPSEGEYDPEQQADRQQDGDVLSRAQTNELEHEAALVLQLGGARQHDADLIHKQDGKHHDRHADEIDGHFSQQIALQDPQQVLTSRWLALHFNHIIAAMRSERIRGEASHSDVHHALARSLRYSEFGARGF